MMVRALTPDGDIVTSGQHFVRDRFAVGQTVTTRLRLFHGEYFLDIDDGTEWFAKVFGRQGLVSTDAVIQRRILRTQHVVSLLSFESQSNIDTRTYSLTSSVLTDFGEVEITTGGTIGG